jgi:Prenyltransferase, beta subunit
MADLQEPEPTLNIDRHLRYWRMCLTAPLPHHYLSNEGNRMALAYFIINSIAILEPSLSPSCSSPDETSKPQRKPLLTPDLRKQLRKWILAHQHPGGGFIATSSLIFPFEEPDNPDGYQSSPGESSDYDPAADYPSPANLPATVFALLLLALLADENDPDGALVGVDRVKTLKWLRRLQREDGSFGEVVRRMPIPGEEMYIGGGYDMRYCYIASAIRWILRGDVKEGDDGWVEDIDIDGLRSYILRTQVRCCSG